MGNKIWIWVIAALFGALGLAFAPREEEKARIEPPPRETTEITQATETALALPYAPENWNLVVEQWVAYEGPYVEDGTGEPVSDVAGLVVQNTGERGISLLVLALEQGDRTTYFSISWLPPGERVLVLAMGRGAYTADAITNCRILGIRWDDFESAPVKVQPYAQNALEVTNQSPEVLEGGKIRYKWYMKEYGMYFGGITHGVQIPPLESGESCFLYPENYGSETSRVVAVVE